MTTFEFQTHITANGGDWPNPSDVQLEKNVQFSRGCLEGMTREEIDRMREERIMGTGR